MYMTENGNCIEIYTETVSSIPYKTNIEYEKIYQAPQ
jgi:hypothetical protein